jgi:hypothetical protein
VAVVYPVGMPSTVRRGGRTICASVYAGGLVHTIILVAGGFVPGVWKADITQSVLAGHASAGVELNVLYGLRIPIQRNVIL